jgi:hypothetical protein
MEYSRNAAKYKTADYDGRVAVGSVREFDFDSIYIKKFYIKKFIAIDIDGTVIGEFSTLREAAAALPDGAPHDQARRTRAEIDDIKTAIKVILKADHPMTVRQVFYQLVARREIEKTEQEYQGTVIRLLTDMRLNDEVSFDWIVDESRRRRENQTYNNIADAARDTARFYRRNALQACPDYLEIWSEKEALAGIIEDAASEYDIPVIVSKGMPSLTQLYGSAYEIARAAHHANKYTHIYQFGDHDPSGVLIPKTLERRLNQLCEKFDCPLPIIERVALTEEQIDEFSLPTRPTKRDGNAHALGFEGDSVELDALPAAELRSMVRKVIEQHISEDALTALRSKRGRTVWSGEQDVRPHAAARLPGIHQSFRLLLQRNRRQLGAMGSSSCVVGARAPRSTDSRAQGQRTPAPPRVAARRTSGTSA